jgi:hypothetical protein
MLAVKSSIRERNVLQEGGVNIDAAGVLVGSPGLRAVLGDSLSFYPCLMLAARITLLHFSVSSAMSLPNSAGDCAPGVPPKSAIRAFKCGSASAAPISLLSLSIACDSLPSRARADPYSSFAGPQPNSAVHKPRDLVPLLKASGAMQHLSSPDQRFRRVLAPARSASASGSV